MSLADGPKHGYAITGDIASFACVRFGPGSLYAAIARLESRGLIVALEAEDRRNPYELTAVGEKALRALVAAAVDAWLNPQSSTAGSADGTGAGVMIGKMVDDPKRAPCPESGVTRHLTLDQPIGFTMPPAQLNRREDSVKKSVLGFVAVAALVGAWSIGRVQGHQDAGKVTYMSADQASFTETTKGVSMAAIWGDGQQGAHATYTKFVPGYDAGMHTHTNDVWIVGIKGAYLYKDDAGEKRVGPGQFLRVPGGKKHWSGGDPKEGALFYEEGSGKFDLVPAK